MRLLLMNLLSLCQLLIYLLLNIININTEYILMDDSDKIFRSSYTPASRPTVQKRPSDSL